MMVLEYLKRRLAERSSWVGMGAAVMGALAIPHPYNYVMMAIGVIAVLVPEQKNV